MTNRYILILFTWIFSFTLLVAQEQEMAPDPIYSENEVPEEYVDENEIFRKNTNNEKCYLVHSEGKYGLEVNGKIIVPMEYELKKNINYSFFVLKKNKVEGLYDANNLKWLVELDTNSIDHVANKFFVISNEYNSTVLNANGEVLLKDFISIEYINDCNFFILGKKVKKDIKFALFSTRKNDFILDYKYAYIKPIVNSSLVGIKKKDTYTLYDPVNDKWGNNKYDSVSGCGFTPKPRVIVELNGLYGVIDEQENQIIPVEYKDVKALNTLQEVVFTATNESEEIDVYQNNGRMMLHHIDNIERTPAHKLKITKKGKFGLCEIKNDSLINLARPIYDEVKTIYKASVVRKGELYDLICEGNTDSDLVFPFTKVQSTMNGTILVTQDGVVSLFDKNECKIGKHSEYTSIEEVDKMYKGWRKYRAYNYLKAEKGDSGYYLLDYQLNLESQRTFHKIIKSQISYIFYEDVNGKIGVYDALSDKDVLEAIYDSVEFYGADIYLYSDGKKASFKDGEVIFK